MELYHGSNVVVRQPRILTPDRRLDFGAGFYMTSSYDQASRWANVTVKRRQNGRAVISVFECDENKMNELSILRFAAADEKWLSFVSANRRNLPINDDFDVIIGPVANDRTMPVINLYFAGFYSTEETIRRLLPQTLKDQYTFKTDKALKLLAFLEARDL